MDKNKSEKQKMSKKEEFVKYREKIYKGSEGSPIFVYKNRDVIIDKHPKKQKIMLGYQTPNGVEWYTDDEALLVWKILLQNKATVGERLYEYHCEDFAF